MKNSYLILLLFLVSCGSTSINGFRNKTRAIPFNSSMNSVATFELLWAKMESCYPRKKSDLQEEGVFGAFDKVTKKGTMYYGIRGLGDDDKGIHMIDVIAEGNNASRVILYSKDDFIRTEKEIKDNVGDWLNGIKGKCRGNALMGQMWREV